MHRLELQGVRPIRHRDTSRSTKDQIRGTEQRRARYVATPSTEVADKTYKLTPSSHIGAVNVGDLDRSHPAQDSDRPRNVPYRLRDGPRRTWWRDAVRVCS